MPMAGPFDEMPLKAVNKSGTADDLKSDDDKKKEEELKPLAEKVMKALDEAVKEVKISTRLHDVPFCTDAADDEGHGTGRSARG